MTPIYIAEDNLLEWSGAKLASNDAFVTSGTGTWVLANSSGTQLATGSLTCTDETTGEWQGVIDSAHTDTLTVDAVYVVTMTIVSGTTKGVRRLNLKAAYHGER